MAWKEELTPDMNKIILGQKAPIYYAFSIASIIKKKGECIVEFNPEQYYIWNGQKRDMNLQWIDVSRLLNDAFDCKIVKEKYEMGKRIIIITW